MKKTFTTTVENLNRALSCAQERGTVDRRSRADINLCDYGFLKLYHCGYGERAEREERVAKEAHAAGIPTPAIIRTFDSDGRRGILFEKIEGCMLHEDLRAFPLKLLRYAKEFAELHALIHSHRISGLPSRKSQLLEDIRRASIPEQQRATIIRRLTELPDGEALCHGDLHMKNVMVANSSLIALDWERGSSGHPAADVAETVVSLQIVKPFSPPLFRKTMELARRFFSHSYLEQYHRLSNVMPIDISSWILPVAAAKLARNQLRGNREWSEQLLAIVNSQLRIRE